MVSFIILLLVCQLAGETVAHAMGWPVPGPVIGLALLFTGLMIYKGVPDGLESVSSGLLNNLALLFVPAGVGVIQYLDLLAQEGLGLILALVISTVIGIAVTGLVMQFLARKPGP